MIDPGKNLTVATAELEDLGRAEKITVRKETTTIVGGKGHSGAIASRVEDIQKTY